MEPANDYPPEIAEKEAEGFVDHYFADIDLGHQHREACFRKVATQISRHPGGTLPDKLGSPARYAAMDRLMNRPETTHAKVLEAHGRKTRAKMEACAGVVLVLHDTTVLDFSGKKSLQLARVGNGNGHGYLCHNSLTVDPQRRGVLGLVSQILPRLARQERTRRASVPEAAAKADSDAPWRICQRRFPVAHIDVADRGGDLFEFLASERRLPGMSGPLDVQPPRATRPLWRGKQVLLHDHLRTLPAVGAARTDLHANGKDAKRPCAYRMGCRDFAAAFARGEYKKTPIPLGPCVSGKRRRRRERPPWNGFWSASFP